jgi:hypothetical protein
MNVHCQTRVTPMPHVPTAMAVFSVIATLATVAVALLVLVSEDVNERGCDCM